MSKAEISLEEKLIASLSKENIDRQILASLLRGDTPEQLAGALFVLSTLFNEAMDLLRKSMEKVNDEAKSVRTYEYLFEVTEHHRQHGLKFEPKRKAGSEASNTKYIKKLVDKNPNLTAKQLQKIADESEIGNITSGTFANKVSEAKKNN
jgi:hypothetical protein